MWFLFVVLLVSNPLFADSSFLRQFEQQSQQVEEPKFNTFAVSTEMEIGKAWPILHQASKGLYVSIGSERSFRGASMLNNASGLIIFDIAPKVLRFSQINRQLLKAKDLVIYRSLRWDADYIQWQKVLGDKTGLTHDDFVWWSEHVRDLKKMRYHYPEMFNRYATDIDYALLIKLKQEVNSIRNRARDLKLHVPSFDAMLQKMSYEKLMKLAQETQSELSSTKEYIEWWRGIWKDKKDCRYQWNKVENGFDLASVVDFKWGNYLFDEKLYARLHTLAVNDRIYVYYLDLADVNKINNIAESIQKDKENIAVLDLDNVYLDGYLGEDKYKVAVAAWSKAFTKDSVLLLMTNYKDANCMQYQLYFGMTGEFFKQWPTTLGVNDYLNSLPKDILVHMNGQLFSDQLQPPLLSIFKK